MIRSKLKVAANKFAAAATAVVLLMFSAAVLTFGFFLSLSLLAITVVLGLFGRRRATTTVDEQGHTVIDLSKADYQHVSQ